MTKEQKIIENVKFDIVVCERCGKKWEHYDVKDWHEKNRISYYLDYETGTPCTRCNGLVGKCGCYSGTGTTKDLEEGESGYGYHHCS